eukprot:9447621-Pyramimonas_sp.AAC.1
MLCPGHCGWHLQELLTTDFGAPLHSFVIPGELHPLEEEMLDFFRPADLPQAVKKKPEEGEDRV